MPDLVRFGVSLEHPLLQAFDRLIRRKHYSNRSEAIRDLIRETLVEQEWGENKEVVGTITMVYDHHVRDLTKKLIDLRHEHHGLVLSVMHVHLDTQHCIEVLVVRGTSSAVRSVADRLIGTKVMKHGKLTMATTGKHLS